MRFVSKSSNLMVVLKPGLPGSTVTGQLPVNGIYIKFSAGTVDVKDEKLVEMLKNHPSFGVDFIAVEDNLSDPYKHHREDVEPAHIIQEMKYGHAGETMGSKKNIKLSPEVKKLLEEEAVKMAKDMLPGMMKEFLTQMKNEQDSAKSEKVLDSDKKEEVVKTAPITKKSVKIKNSEEDAPAA